MTSGNDEAPAHIGPLAEFVALRAEIERRATIQWHVLALQIAVAGAVFGFALAGPRREVLLLAIPVATYMTFGHYIAQIRIIDLISRYIQTDLSPRVPGGLRWESWQQDNSSQMGLGLLAKAHFQGVIFPGVSALAVCAFLITAAQNDLAAGRSWLTVSGVIAVVLLDGLLIAVIVATIWRLNRYWHTWPGWAGDTQAQP
jgi:hypothetical protein